MFNNQKTYLNYQIYIASIDSIAKSDAKAFGQYLSKCKNKRLVQLWTDQ